MDIINILPDSVANQIAAGEVVDRPAGAVKELLENAMDAGATQIDLILKDAGRTLIQTVDNGCGMSESDARLCFERHATSKIHRADDLFAIHTMGFRGEALASIAAIAQVELKTRQTEAEIGTQVIIEGSKIISQQPTVCSTGTSMMVKNLFFNVPARRNFLKKDSVEMSHIEEVFRRITLIHYDIGFSLTHNGRLLYSLPAGGFLQRICGLFGKQQKENLYSVDEKTDIVKIRGFISRPEYCRRTRGEQYIFVNGRFIKHPALSAAVEKAYNDLIPEHTFPSYFIGLQVDPSRIDVNIHPTKTEVKFVDDHALFSILRAAVKKALGQFALSTELSFDTPTEFNIGPAPKGYVPQAPSIRHNPEYNPFTLSPTPVQTSLKMEAQPHRTPLPSTLPPLDAPQPIAPLSTQAKPASCILVQGRYIVTGISSGIAVIDRQRAHERIIYERMMKKEKQSAPQTLLFPINCTFSAADTDLFNEILPDIRSYGFEIAPLGNTTFVVSATPSWVGESDLQALFDRLLTDYKGATMTKFSRRDESICASIARQTAIKAGTPMQQEDMQQFVAELFACPAAAMSPSGKRIIQIVKPEEILGN